MAQRTSIFKTVVVMAVVAISVTVVACYLLYRTALEGERLALIDTAVSQARLMEAIARFDAVQSTDFPGGARAATLSQILEAHEHFDRVSESVEFMIAERVGTDIVFLLRKGETVISAPPPVPFISRFAEPMRRALSGESGTLTGLDYVGETVLAAYEAVPALRLGVVAKVNLRDVRGPYLRVGGVMVALSFLAAVLAGLGVLRAGSGLARALGMADHALMEREAFLGGILEASFEAIITMGEDGKIISANSATVRMFGHELEDLIGADISRLVPESEGARHTDCVQEYLRTGKKHVIGQRREVDALHADGSIIPIDREVSEQFIGDKRVFVGVIRDLTARREAQAQLVQASKMATLGEMATSMAHELNQPLSVIRMAAENAGDEFGEDEPDHDYVAGKLDRIAAQVDRAAEIIDHLRIFGRKPTQAKSAFPLCGPVTRALDLVTEQLRLLGIELKVRMDENCPDVMGHKVQLEQVVLNLVGNARDAISEKLTKTDDEFILVMVQPDKAGDFVSLTVEDSGGGVPVAILPRVFEPFFTTKEAGKGTGLGLSVAYGIVEELSGEISVENTDRGARFRIVLPTAGALNQTTEADSGQVEAG